MEDQKLYEQAQRHVGKLRGFYIHLSIFIWVNAVLVVINLLTSPNYLWFLWVLFGWGIGIVAHAMAVFEFFGGMGSGWEDKKIKEYIEKNKK